MRKKVRKIVLATILTIFFIVTYAFSGVIFMRSIVKAAQPRVTAVVYNQGPLIIYCEAPNGNAVYVVLNSPAGGAAVYVVPGGCR